MDEKNENILNDFVFISDCLPEAFELASILKKCFGISHFTWDWFLKILLKIKKMPQLIK